MRRAFFEDLFTVALALSQPDGLLFPWCHCFGLIDRPFRLVGPAVLIHASSEALDLQPADC